MVYKTIIIFMEAPMRTTTQMEINDPSLGLLNRYQTSKLLGISVALLDLKTKEKKIPVVKIGKAVRFRQSDILAFIEQHREGGTNESHP
jgi:excisionase family DNA binding protein